MFLVGLRYVGTFFKSYKWDQVKNVKITLFVQSCIVESCKSCSNLQLSGKRVITIKILVLTIKIYIGDIYTSFLRSEGINIWIGRSCKERNSVSSHFYCCLHVAQNVRTFKPEVMAF